MSEAPTAPEGISTEPSSPTPERRGRTFVRSQPMDPWLFFAAIALSAIGLVMVYSAGAWLGHEMFDDWEYYLHRQATFLAVGFGLMFGLSRIDYRLLRRFAPQLMLAALGLLVVVLFVGQEINGARRWMRFGPFGLQPSEIAKLTLAIFLAATIARQGERVRTFKRGFLPVVAIASLTMLLVLLEKDLGTTILLGSLTLIMLFSAGTRLSYVVAAVMLAAPLVWQQIIGVDYRRGRLEEFLSGDGYQVHQALIAIGSGGPWGRGLGHGRQKLGFLPENHTDFILATVGEELGFVGIAMVLGLLALLVWRGLEIARKANDRFGTYLATGLSAMFGLQAVINMAVVLELIPAKGITLPFMSYGGSSLLASLASVGILLSISRRPSAWRLSDQRGRGRSGNAGGKDKRGAQPNRPRNARRKPTASPAPA
ncbi:MAG: putative lipid II flippase FtsW [Myxococcota bacterium]